MLDVRWNPTARELRVFALLVPVFTALIAGLFVYRGGSWTGPAWVMGIALVIAVLGLVNTALVRPVYVLWLAAAYPIGWAVSNLVLALTFYLVVTPIGLLLRLFGRDPLERRTHRSPGSYWVRHEPPRDAASYFKQF